VLDPRGPVNHLPAHSSPPEQEDTMAEIIKGKFPKPRKPPKFDTPKDKSAKYQ
jgi:hypothetical protein